MQRQKAIEALYMKESQQGITSETESKLNIQTSVNLTKVKRIVFWLYLLTILAFLVAVAVLTAKTYTPTTEFIKKDPYFYANQVTAQWKRGFITDLKVMGGTTCPAGYQKAINYEWSGSSFGCNCMINSNLTFVVVGYCAPGLIQSGCSNVPSKAKITANNWNNNSLICMKRSAVSFFNQEKYNGINQLCGGSQSLIVVPAGQPCPIINVSFTQFTLQDHDFKVEDLSAKLNPLYASYNSTSPYSFYSYPVSKFTVSQYKFCLMDEDTGISPGHSDFVLLNQQRGCSDPGNFTQLSSITQINFYSSNPGLQALTSMTGFPQPGNWNYLFGFASTPGWTYRCRHTYTGKFSIPKAVEQFDFTYRTMFQRLLIGVTVALVIIFLQILIIGLRRIVNSAVYPVGYKQHHLPKHFFMALSRYIIDFLAKFAILGLTIVNIITTYTNYNWFKSAMNLNCADSNLTTIYQILKPYMDLYETLYKYILTILVITILMIIIDIVHFVYIYRNELTHYLVETEGKMMVKKEQEVAQQYKKEDQDLKWLNQKSLQPVPAKEENEEFRMTMAQNIFNYEQQQSPQKIPKKKKKKISPFKKNNKDTAIEPAQNTLEYQMNMNDLDFNPYSMDIGTMGSLQPQETPQNKNVSKVTRKRRK